MNYAAATIIVAWLLFSWKIAAAIFIVCGVFALFYSEAIEGGADETVKATFFWLVVSMSVLMLGTMTGNNVPMDEDAPKMCNRIEC